MKQGSCNLVRFDISLSKSESQVSDHLLQGVAPKSSRGVSSLLRGLYIGHQAQLWTHLSKSVTFSNAGIEENIFLNLDILCTKLVLARSIFSESLILDCHVMISPILLLKVDSLLCTCFWTVGGFFGLFVFSGLTCCSGPPAPSTGGMPGACPRSTLLRPLNLPISAPVAIFLQGSGFWYGHVIVHGTWTGIHCNRATRRFWFELHQVILTLRSQFVIRLHIHLRRP